MTVTRRLSAVFVRGQAYVMNATARKKLPAPFVGVIWTVYPVTGQAGIPVGIVTGTGCVRIVMTVG